MCWPPKRRVDNITSSSLLHRKYLLLLCCLLKVSQDQLALIDKSSVHIVKGISQHIHNKVFVLGVLCMHFGISHSSFRPLPFRLPNRGDIVPSGVFVVCLPSVYHHRFRSPSFVQATEPWGYRIFWVFSMCTPPSTTADSVCLHSGCRVVIVL